MANINLINLKSTIQTWGRELGFQQIGVSDTSLTQAEHHLEGWITQSYHG